MESKINYPFIKDYLNGLYPQHSKEIREIEDFAHQNSVPIMERESLEVLKYIIKVHKPKRILELGTAIGYSAIIMALLDEEIQITTMDRSEKFVSYAVENIKKFQLEDRIEIVFGEIDENLDKLSGEYDLVMFDAGKSHYSEYFEKTMKLVDDGAIVFSDNVLFKGLIANDDLVPRRQRTITKNMREYLEFLTNSPGISSVVIPVGDGLAISTIEEKYKWKK